MLATARYSRFAPFYRFIKDHNRPFLLHFFLASVPFEEKGPLVSHARKTFLLKKTEMLCGLLWSF